MRKIIYLILIIVAFIVCLSASGCAVVTKTSISTDTITAKNLSIDKCDSISLTKPF